MKVKYKQCPNCGQTFPVKEFYTKREGWYRLCRICRSSKWELPKDKAMQVKWFSDDPNAEPYVFKYAETIEDLVEEIRYKE